MGRRGRWRGWALGAVLALFIVSPAAAQPATVGQAKQIVRSVYGTVEANRRAIVVGGEIYWLDLIETGDESAAQMVFLDQTTLSTGPNSRVRIDEFVYAGGTTASQVIIDVARGVVRFVSGLSPSSVYTVRTPNAMIGVRGTDFTVIVDEDGRTRLFVRRGEISILSARTALPFRLRAGQASTVSADGHVPQGPPEPPDTQTLAAATEVSAMLAIEGEGGPAVTATAAELQDVARRKGQAAATRGATAASQTGPNCGGC